MFRIVLAVILVATVGQAQVGNAIPNCDLVCQHIQAERTQRVLADTQYNDLRRGTEEGFFIRAKIEPVETEKLSVYWGAPSPRNGRLAPTELEIEAPDGFTVHSIRYGKLKKVMLGSDAANLVLGPHTAEFHFELRADSNLEVGHYLLKGKLKFQSVSKAGKSTAQELQFDIPVHVVEHKTKVNKNWFYPAGMTAMNWIHAILFAPLVLIGYGT